MQGTFLGSANERTHVSEMLETASGSVAARVPVVVPQAEVGDIRHALFDKVFDAAGSIAVCEDGKLLGVLRIEDVLGGAETATAAELMDTHPPVLAPGTDQESAVWRAVQHGESSLAVVDAHGRFMGFIPADRLLAILLAEHDEDMARLGGFLGDASAARTASREAVLRRLWHRLPWLLLGLTGAFAAAGIVGSFEEELQKNVILAFFMPGIVYMADAVGTQTETLVVRGLSVGITIREVVKRELLTGLLMGIALALAFVPVGLWRWGESDVVAAVALALFAACSISTVVAMLLPWALHRMGRDPAFGSGPLATVIQDILSVLIYFLIAVNLVH